MENLYFLLYLAGFIILAALPLSLIIKNDPDYHNVTENEDFGEQPGRKLNDEETLINKEKLPKKDDDKIDFVFDEVKNSMK
jgi:hypothetical protein